MEFSGQKPIVFFDGHCNLCNASVRFLIENDRRSNLQFASLQSQLAERLLHPDLVNSNDMSTVVLWENGSEYYRSEAGVRIASYLSAPWNLLRFGRFVPRVVRDGLYNFVARKRYQWFGRSEECMIPTEEVKSRFPEGLASDA